mgnify:CR=1 FL=1
MLHSCSSQQGQMKKRMSPTLNKSRGLDTEDMPYSFKNEQNKYSYLSKGLGLIS